MYHKLGSLGSYFFFVHCFPRFTRSTCLPFLVVQYRRICLLVLFTLPKLFIIWASAHSFPLPNCSILSNAAKKSSGPFSKYLTSTCWKHRNMDASRRRSGRPLAYNRSILLRAVADVQDRRARGIAASVRETADRFHIPKSTLHRHLKTTPLPTPCTLEQAPKTAIRFLISMPSKEQGIAHSAPYSDCRCAREVQILQAQLAEVHQVVAHLTHALSEMEERLAGRTTLLAEVAELSQNCAKCANKTTVTGKDFT